MCNTVAITTKQKSGASTNRAGRSERQRAQRDLVEQARSMPGVAQILDVYGRLDQYTSVLVNVQPGQVRNATGGNG